MNLSAKRLILKLTKMKSKKEFRKSEFFLLANSSFINKNLNKSETINFYFYKTTSYNFCQYWYKSK